MGVQVPSWDPGQYARYADERSRPFHELVARVPVDAPRQVVDLGCGPGRLTRRLAERWPAARVVGVDNSATMIAAAAEHRLPDGRLDFVESDLRDYAPPGPVDLVVSNASLQWVPDHLALLPRFVDWLSPEGVLAFQVPDNFAEPSHRLLRELRDSPRWRSRVGDGADRSAAVHEPVRYLQTLAGLGLTVDVWTTTYLHVLTGDDPVLEWTKGTALRPVLDVLPDGDRAPFLDEYAAALRAAYPPGPAGTVFPFRRTFVVAHRTAPPPRASAV